MNQLHTSPFSALRQTALTALCQDLSLARALVVGQEDFLTAVPSESEQALLEAPDALLWERILPYRRDFDQEAAATPLLCLSFEEVKKTGAQYAGGYLYLYCFVPTALEKTAYGRRSDYLIDRAAAILDDPGGAIGRLRFYARGDRAVFTGCTGQYVAFETTQLLL